MKIPKIIFYQRIKELNIDKVIRTENQTYRNKRFRDFCEALSE